MAPPLSRRLACKSTHDDGSMSHPCGISDPGQSGVSLATTTIGRVLRGRNISARHDNDTVRRKAHRISAYYDNSKRSSRPPRRISKAKMGRAGCRSAPRPRPIGGYSGCPADPLQERGHIYKMRNPRSEIRPLVSAHSRAHLVRRFATIAVRVDSDVQSGMADSSVGDTVGSLLLPLSVLRNPPAITTAPAAREQPHLRPPGVLPRSLPPSLCPPLTATTDLHRCTTASRETSSKRSLPSDSNHPPG